MSDDSNKIISHYVMLQEVNVILVIGQTDRRAS